MAGIEKAQPPWGETAPKAQVVNNSGDLLYQVNVGDVVFTEHLSDCGSGCSTGFIDVVEGTNDIVVYQSETSIGESLGSVGQFQKSNNYAVNIRNVDGYCAELWQRFDTSGTFNDDTTRVLIDTGCP